MLPSNTLEKIKKAISISLERRLDRRRYADDPSASMKKLFLKIWPFEYKDRWIDVLRLWDGGKFFLKQHPSGFERLVIDL